MTDPIPGRRARFAPPSLATACVALTATVVAAWAIAGGLAYQRQGLIGLQVATVAAFTCWFAATLALLFAGWLRNTPHSVSGVLGGTVIRVMLPLAVAAFSQAAKSPLAQAGLFGYLVLFFLLTLTAETLLLVWLLDFGGKPSGNGTFSKAA